MNPEVQNFIDNIADEQMKLDAQELIKIMNNITNETPYMYGSSIIGFGSYHYKYASGREGDYLIVGFSPRKAALVFYGVIFYEEGGKLLPKLGKYKAGKGCLYIKKLSDIDIEVLKEMIKNAYQEKIKNK